MSNTYILPERIDTASYTSFENEVESFIAQNDAQSLTLDAEKLTYISSAGLRVLLKLRKAQEINIINVCPQVYEVFQTTGFDTLINIKKAMRSISVEGCEIIGSGITGTVYRLDSDTIAKVYDRKVPLSSIERERELARTAFLNGVPTAISYDVVKCGDTYGIVFELINADTFASCFHNRPDTFDHYAGLYADTLLRLHSAHDEEKVLPEIKVKYHNWIEGMRVYFNDEEIQQLHRLVDSVPDTDTIIHGDFHPKNIMIQNGEPLLIDMSDVSRGNPVFDLAGIGMTHRYYAVTAAEKSVRFLGVDAEEVMRLWYYILSRYFNTHNKDVIMQKEEMLMPYVLLRYVLQPAVFPLLDDDEKLESVKAAREKLLPYIDEIIEKGLNL